MGYSRELQAALEAADRLQAERSQISAAITTAESELPGALTSRLECEKILAATEASQAMGQGREGATAEAHKALSDARQRVDALAARIIGLRERLHAHEDALSAAILAIEAMQPQVALSVAADFTPAWNEGVRAFSLLLGRRRAIEAALDKSLDLVEPQALESPGVADVATDALVRVRTTLETLRQALGQIRTAATLQARGRRAGAAHYDADGIYVFVRPATIAGRVFEATQVVMGRVLGEGATTICLRNHSLKRVDHHSAVAAE